MMGKRRQSGFSLMEVLFAVLVLTMGLVFVASQFPLGLSNAKKVVQTVTNDIDIHNREVMDELMFNVLLDKEKDFRQAGIPSPYIGNGYNFLYTDDGTGFVYYKFQPNVYFESGLMVMDDPYGFYYYATTGNPPLDPIYYAYPGDLTPTANVPYLPPGYTNINDRMLVTGDLAVDDPALDNAVVLEPLNIGQVVLPPVTIDDPEVQSLLKQRWPTEADVFSHYADYWAYANNYIFNAALSRQYCQSIFYRFNSLVASDNSTMTYYIFTLKRDMRSNVRYAQQDAVSSDFTPCASAWDRVFPTPWYIRYIRGTLAGANSERFVLQEFSLCSDNQLAMKMIRKGSFFLDMTNGEVYKVIDITEGFNDTRNESQVILTFNRSISMSVSGSDFNSFWIFPPAIINVNNRERLMENQFAELQPVVDVQQRIISIDR